MIEPDVRLVTERDQAPRQPPPRGRWWLLLPGLGLMGVLALALATPAAEAPAPISPGTSLPTVANAETDRADIRTGWQRIPLPGTGWLVDAESTALGLVAVGHRWDGDGFVWSSSGGVTWDYLGAIPRSRPTGVAAAPMGVVVVGTERLDESLPYREPANARPFAWWSVDGSTWQGSLLEVGEGNTGEARGVVADQSGRLVAYGWETAPAAAQVEAGGHPLLTAPVIWHSEGGRSWQRAALPAQQEAWIADAIVTEGGFVAVGSDGQRPALWTSLDGGAWQGASLEGNGGDWELGSIAQLPEGGYLALLTRRDSAELPYITSLWRSDDLLVWEAVEPSGIFGEIGFSDLETLGARVFGTVRHDRQRQVFSGPEIWFTADGEQWRAVVGSATSGLLTGSIDAEVMAIAVHDEGLVAVGHHTLQPIAWAHGRREVPSVRLPEIPAGEGEWVPRTVLTDDRSRFGLVWEAGGRLVTFLDAEAWFSDDGVGWTPTGEVVGQTWGVQGVVEGGPGMVAYGRARNGEPGLWLSKDGWRWEAVDLSNVASYRVSWAAEIHGKLLAQLAALDGLGRLVVEVVPLEEGWSVREIAEVGPQVVWDAFTIGARLVGNGVYGGVYFSPNGVQWEQVLSEGILVGSTGSVVFANDSDGSLLVSSDGREWTDTGLSGIHQVMASQVGAAALGGGTVWVSSDLIEWEPIPADLDHGLAAGSFTLIPGTDRLLLLGGNHGKVAIWEWLP